MKNVYLKWIDKREQVDYAVCISENMSAYVREIQGIVSILELLIATAPFCYSNSALMHSRYSSTFSVIPYGIRVA